MADHDSPRARQRSLWPSGLILLAVLVGTQLHDQSAEAAERTGPVKIGALTQSWGPTPPMIGLRDGLLALGYREGRTEEEARTTLATLRKGEVDGIVAPSNVALNIPGFILDATLQHAIPTMFIGTFFVERGGLASYSSDGYESGRLAARLVDKILRGEDPGRIPVETNPKFELAINMKVARALKLTISPAVSQRANRLIE